jgi:hypothetical protein
MYVPLGPEQAGTFGGWSGTVFDSARPELLAFADFLERQASR